MSTIKALVSVKLLVNAINAVKAAVPRRGPKPILESVKLSLSADGSTVEATDLEYGIRAVVLGASVDQGGSLLLPMPAGLDALKSFAKSDEEIALDVSEDGTILLRGHRSTRTLDAPGAAEDYPECILDAPEGPDVARWSIDNVPRFGERLAQCLPFTDPDCTR
jgi:DNA polymerase-3 subunit beta